MVSIQFEDDEALVLCEFLARHEELDKHGAIAILTPLDRSEVLALWGVQRGLEQTLVAPLRSDYSSLVEAARTSVRERWGPE